MHKLIWSAGDLLFVLVVTTVCVALAVTWWRFRDTRYPQMTNWRRIALRSGLAGNTLSLVLLLGFLALSLLRKEAMLTHPNLQAVFSFLFWTIFSLATALCGAFGRGGARLLVMTNGVVLTSLWYFLGLANSL
jgi:hypothetical protein